MLQAKRTPTTVWHAPVGAAILFVALALGACATGLDPVVDYSDSYDFSDVKTVAFYEGSGSSSMANPLGLSDITRERIDRALEGAVRSAGLRFVDDPGAADLLLSWHLATENRTEVRSVQRPGSIGAYHVGFGPYNRYSMYQCWSCVSMETETIVRDYVEGTFIVDFIDPALDKSVWRSVTRTRLKDKPDLRQATFDEGAREVLAGFPPA